MNAPCYNCSDRKLSCHDSCVKYKEFRSKVDGIKKSEKIFNYGRSVIIESSLRQNLSKI